MKLCIGNLGKWNSVKWNETRRIGAILACFYVARVWQRQLGFLVYIYFYHRLRGSASPVLTATHHSHGSPKLSNFFPADAWRSDPATYFDAKWLNRRGFTQGCAFCSKNRNVSYPLISRAPIRAKFRKFLDLETFPLDLAFNIRGHRENTPYSSSELNESDIVNRQSGVRNWNIYLNFT